MNGFLQRTGFAVDHSLCINPLVDFTLRIMCYQQPKICIKHPIIAFRVWGFTWCLSNQLQNTVKRLPSFLADVFRACWKSSAVLPFRDKD